MFDLASDTAMKQVLESSVHQVSAQLTVCFLQLLLCSLIYFYSCVSSVALAGYDPPCQEIRRTPLEGKVWELLSVVAERTLSTTDQENSTVLHKLHVISILYYHIRHCIICMCMSS